MVRMSWRGAWFAVAFAALGCQGGNEEECTPVVEGAYTFDGTSMGMAMGAAVTVDASGCAFSIVEWTMPMASLPSGGTVAGDEVALSGDDAYWSTCTGTIDPSGESADGVCDEDGSTWSMVLGAMMTMER
jgi:hypothetical protein